MNTELLPVPIAAYIQASNDNDHDALAALFLSDAVVRDEGKTYVGPSEIRAWSKAAAEAYEFRLELLSLEESELGVTATCRVSGAFGDPIDLPFEFSLEGEKIKVLTIDGG